MKKAFLTGLISVFSSAALAAAGIRVESALGTQGKVSGTTLTVSNTSLKYLSGDYPANCSAVGWYAGATLTWGDGEMSASLTKPCKISFSDNCGRSVGEFGHYWAIGRMGIETNLKASGIYLGAMSITDDADPNYYNTKTEWLVTSYYQSRIDWRVWLTAGDVYKLRAAGEKSYVARLTVGGGEFRIEIPLQDLTLKDADGVTWYPAAAVQDDGAKVWTDVNAAFAAFDGTKLALDRDAVASTDFTLGAGRTLDLGGRKLMLTDGTLTLKSGSMLAANGADQLVLAGGGIVPELGSMFGFEPNAAWFSEASKLCAEKTGGHWLTVVRHVHNWTIARPDATTLVATCDGEGTCRYGNRIAVTLSSADCTYDAKAHAAALGEGAQALADATGGTITPVLYSGIGGTVAAESAEPPVNAGSYRARVIFTDTGHGGTLYVLETSFTIARAAIDTLALSATSLDYNGRTQTVSVDSVRAGNLEATYALGEGSVLAAKAIGAYSVSVVATGNFTGTLAKGWTIDNASGGMESVGASAAGSGTYADRTLTVTDTRAVKPDADGAWYVGLAFTWPEKVSPGVTGGSYEHAQYVRPSAAEFTVDGVSFSGEDALAGRAVFAGGRITSVTNVGSRIHTLLPREDLPFTYLQTSSVELRITPETLAQAKRDGLTTLSRTVTVGAMKWGDRVEGSTEGVAFADYTITLELGDLVLNDEWGNQVYPALDYVAQVEKGLSPMRKYLSLDEALSVARTAGQEDERVVLLTNLLTKAAYVVGPCPGLTLDLGGWDTAYSVFSVADTNVSVTATHPYAHVVTTDAERDYMAGYAIERTGPAGGAYAYAPVSVDAKHVHVWTLSAEGDALVATCSGKGDCGHGGEIRVALLAADKVYDGNPAAATVDASALADLNGTEGLVAGEVRYVDAETDGSAYDSTVAPTEVGAYKATVTIVDRVRDGREYALVKAFSITPRPHEGALDKDALSTTASGCAVVNGEVRVTDSTRLECLNATTWRASASVRMPLTLPDLSTTQDDANVRYVDEAHLTVTPRQGTVQLDIQTKEYKIPVVGTVLASHRYVKAVNWTVEISLADVLAAVEAGQSELAYELEVAADEWTHYEGLDGTVLRIVVPLEGLVLNDRDGVQVYPGHVHAWSCRLDGNRLTATCGTAGCPQGALTLELAAESRAFNGRALSATLAGAADFATHTGARIGAITYNGGASAPTRTGDYTAEVEVTVGETSYTLTKAFAIAKADLSSVNIVLNAEGYSFDGTVHRNGLKTVSLGDYALQGGVDYTVGGDAFDQTGSPAKDMTYTVTITAAGDNFTGEVTRSWTITTLADGMRFGTPVETGRTVSSASLKVTVPVGGILDREFTPTEFLCFESSRRTGAFAATDKAALESCGIALTDDDILASKYKKCVTSFTWTEAITREEVAAALARGEAKIVRTLTAYALAYAEGLYTNNGGIRAVEYRLEFVLADYVNAAVVAETGASSEEVGSWIAAKVSDQSALLSSKYVKASFDLGVDLIDGKTVEIIDYAVGETVTFRIEIDKDASPEIVKAAAAKVAGYIQATTSLSDGFTATIDPSRVTIDAQSGIVTIRPNLAESAEFLRVFVPSDK